MVNTTIAALGSSVLVSSERDEQIIPALGDGTAKPGDLVSIVAATGKVVQTDVGAQEKFTGILMEHPLLGCDTAITDALFCSVVIPKSGHSYNVRMADQGGAKEVGQPMTFSSTAGSVTDATTAILGKVGNLALPIVDDDTVCQLRWA